MSQDSQFCFLGRDNFLILWFRLLLPVLGSHIDVRMCSLYSSYLASFVQQDAFRFLYGFVVHISSVFFSVVIHRVFYGSITISHSFFHWWIVGLFLHFTCCKEFWYNHLHINLCEDVFFKFLLDASDLHDRFAEFYDNF